jgi:RNA polymerase subunit RPABC4/transcription elongation factor Spt4
MAIKVHKQTKEIIDTIENKDHGHSSDQLGDAFKGKVIVLDEEKSEIAQALKIKKKGSFAIKVGS